MEEKVVDEPKTGKKIKALQHRFGRSIIISSKVSDEEDHLYDGNSANQPVRPQNQVPSNEEVSLSHSIFEDDIKNYVAEEKVTKEKVTGEN